MSTIATLVTRFASDTRDFHKGVAEMKSDMGSLSKSTDSAMGSMEKSTSGVGSKIASGLGSVARSAGQMVATGFTVAAGGAAAFGVSSAKTALRASEMDAALGALAKSTGNSKQAMDTQVAAVRKTGIEMGVAQNTVAQFARSNLDMSKTTDIARVAQDAAVVSGKNSTETLDSIIQGITTQNSLVLKNAGLQVQAGQAVSNYAKALGKSTSELTDAERAQAVMNAVLEDGKNLAGSYEAAMQEPGKVLRSFPRIFDDIKLSIGGAMTGAFGPLILKAYDLAKAISGSLQPGGALRDVVTALGEKLAQLMGPIGGFIDKAKEWIGAIKPEQVQGITDKISGIGPAAGAAGAALGVMGMQNIPILGSLVQGISPIAAGIIGLIASTEGGREAIGALVKALVPMVTTLASTLMPVLNDLLSAVGPVIGTLGQLAGEVLTALLDALKPILPVLGEVAKIIGGALQNAMVTIGPTIGKVIDALGRILAGVAPLLPRIAELAGTLIELAVKAIVPLVPPILKLVEMAIGPLGALIQALMPIVTKIATILVDFLSRAIKPLLPVITRLADVLSKTLTKAFKALGPILERLFDAIGPVIGQLGELAGKVLSQLLDALIPLIPPLVELATKLIDLAVRAVTPLYPVFLKLYEAVILPLLPAILSLLPPIVSLVEALLPIVDALIPIIELVAKLLAGIVGLMAGALGPVIGMLATFVALLLGGVIDAITAVIGFVADFAKGFVDAFVAVKDFFVGLPDKIIGFFKEAGAWLLGAGKTVIGGLWNGIKAVWDSVHTWFSELPSRITGFFVGAGEWLLDAGKKIIGGLLGGVRSMWDTGYAWFTDLPGKIIGFFANAGEWLLEAGKKIIGGLIDGIKKAADGVKGAVGGIAKKVTSFLPLSPAKEGPLRTHPPEVAGRNIALQIAAGIQSGAGAIGAAMNAALSVSGAPTPVATGPAMPATPVMPTTAMPTAPDMPTVVAPDASAFADFVATVSGAFDEAGQAGADYAAQLAGVEAMADATLGSHNASLVAFAGMQVTTWQTMAGQIQATADAMNATLTLNALGLSAQISASTQEMSSQVTNIWAQMAAAVGVISVGMANDFVGVMTQMTAAAITGGTNTGSGLTGTLSGAATPITEIVRGYARSLRDALNPILEGIDETAIALPFATGGPVPGSGNGDSVPAMLTPGEYVIRKDIAARLGFDTLNKLNQGQRLGYEEGGVVAAERYASSMVGKPYVWGGAANYSGVDCSGLYSGIFAQAMGLPMQRYFTTHAFMGGSAPQGWARGPGAIQVGVNMQHMAGDINGRAYEAGHTPIAGPESGASPASSPQFGGNIWHIEAIGGGKYVVTEPITMPEVPAVDTGGEWFGGTATKLMTHVKDLAQAWTDANTMVMTAMGPAGELPGGDVDSWIRQGIALAGKPESWFAGIVARARQESNFDPRAINNWDSNATAGTPSKGIMQMIDPTFRAYMVPGLDDIWNPIHNVAAACNYIASRYGSPYNLPAGGYAAGGIVPATPGGRTITAGEGGRDEAVIPLPAAWRSMFADTAAGSTTTRSGPAVHIEHYEVREDADHRRIFAMASFEERAGRI